MIISSGYNIAGPGGGGGAAVSSDVAECAVVGAPDDERGQIVEAHVVLKAGMVGDDACASGCRITSRRPSRPTSIRARSSS